MKLVPLLKEQLEDQKLEQLKSFLLGHVFVLRTPATDFYQMMYKGKFTKINEIKLVERSYSFSDDQKYYLKLSGHFHLLDYKTNLPEFQRDWEAGCLHDDYRLGKLLDDRLDHLLLNYLGIKIYYIQLHLTTDNV